MMWCNSPKCACQPGPPKQAPGRIQVVLRGDQPGQIRHLHQPDAEFDINCDMIGHDLTLRETVGDPRTITTATQYNVHLTLQNSCLVNLEGLADNSLLLSLEMRPEACSIQGHDLRLETKVWSFRPTYTDSKLHDDLYLCDWPTMILQLHLPASRVRGWKTVAMILLTFGWVTRENWINIVNIQNPPAVAGLNWRRIEQRVRSEMKKSKLAKEEVLGKGDAAGLNLF